MAFITRKDRGKIIILGAITIYLLYAFVNHSAHEATSLSSPMPGQTNSQTANERVQDNISANADNEQGYHNHGLELGGIITLLQKGQYFDNSPHYWKIANAAVQPDGVIFVLAKCLIDNRLQEISNITSARMGQSDEGGTLILYGCGQIFTNYEATICPDNPAPCDGYGQQAAYYAEHEIK